MDKKSQLLDCPLLNPINLLFFFLNKITFFLKLFLVVLQVDDDAEDEGGEGDEEGDVIKVS